MNGHCIIAIALSLLSFSLPAKAEFKYEPLLSDLRQDLELGDKYKLASRTNFAIDAMVNLAVYKLRHKGKLWDARHIEQEWITKYSRMLTREDLGDHAALNGWLQALYIYLEYELGTFVMELTHLDDLNILNLAIPVVFHMDIIDDAETIDAIEYGKHAEPFFGVLAYWGTWAGCTFSTAGATAFIVCSPIGMLAEFATVEWIAPPFSPFLWSKFYP